MSLIEAIILGIVQGLAEFLPISSSGHLVLGEALLGSESADSLTFTIVVHFATVLSTIIIFWKDIVHVIRGLLQFKWNEETRFTLNILLSMIPVTLVGLLLKEQVEAAFEGNILFVGLMLMVTGLLLFITIWAPKKAGDVNPVKAVIIGIAQAVAVLPGISRSGSTIAMGLMLGVDKAKMARFSFLMVIPPIVGIMLMDMKDLATGEATISTPAITLAAGFIAAFITGLAACRIMINIVKQGKIQYFAYYCFAVGIITIILSFRAA